MDLLLQIGALAKSAEYRENTEIDIVALTREGQQNSIHRFSNPWISRSPLNCPVGAVLFGEAVHEWH
ncbi:hypothetical protein [Mongoliitalea lutea]|uniref:Uncharacterized protein n=1 Tax=Mongoliitalea lutea TaxID=849756 RepID=A0A8J3CXP6_9BACT|nr:hypothetical protein [Mongoliitalea lutea]GHB36363.1 hypothetical protein GCM10008106_17060 [Mongoliitalea lutea]